MAHVRQSRPYSGLSVEAKAFEMFEVVPSSPAPSAAQPSAVSKPDLRYTVLEKGVVSEIYYTV